MHTRVVQSLFALFLAGCLRIEALDLVAPDAGRDAGGPGAAGTSEAGSASQDDAAASASDTGPAPADAADAEEPRTACRVDFDCNNSWDPATMPGPDLDKSVCAPDGYCLERRDAFGATIAATSTREIHNLVSDGATLYWMTAATTTRTFEERLDAELWRLNPGSEPELVSASLETASFLRVYGDYVYWSGSTTWKIRRMPKSGGAVETLYAFDGCHNFVVDDDRLILVSRAGVEIGALDGSVPLEKVGDISVFRPDQAGYTGDCQQRVALEAGEVFFRRDDALLAINVASREERALARSYGRLLDVRDGYLYLLSPTIDLDEQSFFSNPFGPDGSVRFSAVRQDLKSEEWSSGAMFALPAREDGLYFISDGELRDSYVYFFAETYFEDFWDIRVSVSRGRPTGSSSSAEQLIPLDWRPRGIPPHNSRSSLAHAATAEDYYVALPYGPGGVLYKFALPAPP